MACTTKLQSPSTEMDCSAYQNMEICSPDGHVAWVPVLFCERQAFRQRIAESPSSLDGTQTTGQGGTAQLSVRWAMELPSPVPSSACYPAIPDHREEGARLEARRRFNCERCSSHGSSMESPEQVASHGGAWRPPEDHRPLPVRDGSEPRSLQGG
jgi:hypothetical protein